MRNQRECVCLRHAEGYVKKGFEPAQAGFVSVAAPRAKASDNLDFSNNLLGVYYRYFVIIDRLHKMLPSETGLQRVFGYLATCAVFY